jgi:TPR repeat protein
MTAKSKAKVRAITKNWPDAPNVQALSYGPPTIRAKISPRRMYPSMNLNMTKSKFMICVIFAIVFLGASRQAHPITDKAGAKKGYPAHQTRLGFTEMEKGNFEAAQKWWKLAADKAYEGAQVALGMSYRFGWGVPIDYKAAAKWFKLASDQEDPRGQAHLGMMHILGHGVPQNYRSGRYLVSLGAYQGGKYEQYLLGSLYNPYAPAGQIIKNTMWFDSTLDGFKFRKRLLGPLYTPNVPEDQVDQKASVKWFKLSADQKFSPAQYRLGLMYAYGQGVAHNDETALKWFKLAAQQNHPAAQFNLGKMYAEGRGVLKDHVRAHMWFTIAAFAGDMNAQLIEHFFGRTLTPAQMAKSSKMAGECARSYYKKC